MDTKTDEFLIGDLVTLNLDDVDYPAIILDIFRYNSKVFDDEPRTIATFAIFFKNITRKQNHVIERLLLNNNIKLVNRFDV